MVSEADRFDLGRFLTAQEPVYAIALEELRRGQKRSHWMWFIFPQLRGLGRSATAEKFGIASLAEARAYLRHRVLGERLVACTQAVLSNEDRSLHQIFGAPDDQKFRSSMSLFALAAGDEVSIYRDAVDRYCSGQMDERTMALLPETTASSPPD